KVFNNGDLERDFTYIDDIIDGVVMVISDNNDATKYSLYNIGNSSPVKLMNFINEIEKQLGFEAKKNMLPMQAGDVTRTWADVNLLKRNFGYNPITNVKEGVAKFIAWYKEYYSIN